MGHVTTILLQILSHLAAVLAAMLLFPALMRLRYRMRHRGLLGLDAASRTALVLADRPVEGEATASPHGTFVKGDDLFSMTAVQSALQRCGWHPASIEVREATWFDADDPTDHRKNVFLFCSPKSNPVTRVFMDELSRTGLLEWRFVEDQASGQWRIEGKRGHWNSPSYAQEAALLAMNRPLSEGRVDDYAIFARLPNPWNLKAKVFILAGIRGLGTRGAGDFLRDNLPMIKKLTRGKDFVWLLHVTKEHYRIKQVELVIRDDCPGSGSPVLTTAGRYHADQRLDAVEPPAGV